jgi:hypothetical protein
MDVQAILQPAKNLALPRKPGRLNDLNRSKQQFGPILTPAFRSLSATVRNLVVPSWSRFRRTTQTGIFTNPINRTDPSPLPSNLDDDLLQALTLNEEVVNPCQVRLFEDDTLQDPTLDELNLKLDPNNSTLTKGQGFKHYLQHNKIEFEFENAIGIWLAKPLNPLRKHFRKFVVGLGCLNFKNYMVIENNSLITTEILCTQVPKLESPYDKI